MNQVEKVDVLGHIASMAVRYEEWEAIHDAVAELVAVGRLIESGAMPATNSGATCFVPRYEVEKLRAALRPFNGSDKA